jgi:hypothetical protein
MHARLTQSTVAWRRVLRRAVEVLQKVSLRQSQAELWKCCNFVTQLLVRTWIEMGSGGGSDCDGPIAEALLGRLPFRSSAGRMPAARPEYSPSRRFTLETLHCSTDGSPDVLISDEHDIELEDSILNSIVYRQCITLNSVLVVYTVPVYTVGNTVQNLVY